MKRNTLIAACLGLAMLTLGAAARADQLDDIKAKGELVCGTLGTSQPFSFQDASTRQLVGYDVDVCKLVADKLGVKISYKLLSVAARVPELNEGRVDILAANLGYSPDRAGQIAFSHAYYVSPQKLLVRKDSGLDTIESVNGRRVAATKGSSSEREIKRVLDKSQVLGFGDSSSAYLALQQKKVDAQFASELVLVRLQLQSPPTAPVSIIPKSVFDEFWGLGVRKSEPRFLQAVNQALDDAEASGAAAQLFDKWFGAQTQYKLQRSFKIAPIAG
ncbi:cysteine ABC transporter substrate-binding protein [Bordetella genomosp. 10]|uniref:Cysteine ABC transporter substrate-binding protein n=1 Tax=Bordetella genomosp. 10 TaxID=1416804 RepID=A0A261SCL0_9BORD|nr:ABC transporter substrate-binding protein [Bordetella genomosp. 10]OZI34113.1 cysteine ABC transporter substrate-binding protein [Bordetella genomosp. 10]